MGCVSSKVGQTPPEQAPGHAAHKHGESESRAVESRPALPVAESIGACKAPRGRAKSNGKGEPMDHALHSGQEAEGETVTDVTGLQMRTPRTSTDRGLHYAAKNGNLPLVHKLLGYSTGANSCQSQARDTSSPDRTICTALAVDLDERGMWGNTPLLVATQYAHPQVALALIAEGANTCLENERRATALHYSCAEGLLDVTRALLENGADVDPPVTAVHHPAVNGGQTIPVTPLSAASTGGHTELVRMLVERGAEIDRRVSPKSADGQERRTSYSGFDGVGGSALTAAARYGHTETCLCLIDSGASVLLEDWDTRTPLLHAILGGHEQTSLALLDVARNAGCARQIALPGELGTPAINPSRVAPLHAACDSGMHNVVKTLLEAGAQVESRDDTGATPLLCASRKGRLQCVRELLSRGADPMAEDHKGTTPLSAAQRRIERSGGQEIVRLIEAALRGPERENRQDQERPGAPQGKQDSQRKAEYDDEDEDVLLISDWDENVDGVDVLDDCDVLDVSSHTQNATDQKTTGDRDPEHQTHTRTAVEWHPIHDPRVTGGSVETEIQDIDEDVDVLLVGDYDPDMEEGPGLADVVPSPAGSFPRRDSGSPEVQSISAETLLQTEEALAWSETAASSPSIPDHTIRHNLTDDQVEDWELRPGGSGGSRADVAKRDPDFHSEDVTAVENLPQVQQLQPHEGLLTPPAAVQHGGLHHHLNNLDHDLKPQHLAARLSTHEVAADSVGMVLATAAGRIVIGQPARGG